MGKARTPTAAKSGPLDSSVRFHRTVTGRTARTFVRAARVKAIGNLAAACLASIGNLSKIASPRAKSFYPPATSSPPWKESSKMFGKPQWFRPKAIGWGLIPISWQGWLYAGGWTGAISLPFLLLIGRHQPVEAMAWLTLGLGALTCDVWQILRGFRAPPASSSRHLRVRARSAKTTCSTSWIASQVTPSRRGISTCKFAAHTISACDWPARLWTRRRCPTGRRGLGGCGGGRCGGSSGRFRGRGASSVVVVAVAEEEVEAVEDAGADVELGGGVGDAAELILAIDDAELVLHEQALDVRCRAS